MELLKQLKGIFIVPSEESDSFADYIDLLIERLQTAYRLEDKIEALKAISTFAKVKKYKIDVGAKCIEPLIETIEANATSFELVILSLDCLRYIMSTEDTLENEEDSTVRHHNNHPPVANDNQTNVEIQFTEIFMKNVKNLAVIIKFLEEYDFGVRYSALTLLEALVLNAHKLVQASILKIENGLSKILDLLGDSREIIRNQALISLVVLVKGTAELQKIMAFENGFDLVLDILRNEDYSNGGVVSQDCLTLLLHLLKGNPSNQILFLEQGYMSKLCPFFDSIHQEDLDRDFVVDLKSDLDKDPTSDITTPDKLGNILLMLEILRVFVSPTLPPTMVLSSQRSILKCGLLQKVTDNILMASGIPHNILTEAISATAEILHACTENQDFFSTVMAPSNPPRSLVAVLLMSMLNEKKPLDLRYAILYLFQSYLSHNWTLQGNVIQTLLSPSGEVTVGRILLTGLFSSGSDNLAYPLSTFSAPKAANPAAVVITEGMSTWFAAVALSHALSSKGPTSPEPTRSKQPPAAIAVSNKEQLLRVRLAGSGSEGPDSDGTLLKNATDFLKKTKNLHSKIGIMVLLSTWLTDCPKAVRSFLSFPENIPYLVAQINESGQVSGGNSHTFFDVNATAHEARHQLLFSVLQSLSAFAFGLCVLFNDNALPDFKTENLKAIINKRLGVENYVNKLTQLQKSPNLGRARTDYINVTSLLKYEDFILDSEFIKVMTFYETFILKLFEHKNLKKDLKFDQIDFVTKKYEDRLKEKESHIELLNQSCDDYKHQLQLIATKYEELNAQLKTVNDQNCSIMRLQQQQQQAPMHPPNSVASPGNAPPYQAPNTPHQQHPGYGSYNSPAFQPQYQPVGLTLPPETPGSFDDGSQGPPGGNSDQPGGQNFYLNGPYYDSYHQNFTLTTVSARNKDAKRDPNEAPDDGNISVMSEELNLTTRMNDHKYRLLADEHERLKADNRELREALDRLQKEQEGFLILIDEYEKRLEHYPAPPTPAPVAYPAAHDGPPQGAQPQAGTQVYHEGYHQHQYAQPHQVANQQHHAQSLGTPGTNYSMPIPHYNQPYESMNGCHDEGAHNKNVVYSPDTHNKAGFIEPTNFGRGEHND